MKKFISLALAITIAFSGISATAIEASAKTTTTTSTSDTNAKRTGKKLSYDEAYERLKPLFEDNTTTKPTTTKPATSANGKLPAPTGITATKSANKIVLKWDEVDGADAYRVYMYNSKTKKYEKYKTVKGEQCTVTNITKNKEYKFIVAALKIVNGKYKAGENSKAVSTTQATKPTTTTKPATNNDTQTTQQSGDYIKMTDFWGNELSSSMRVRRSYLTKDQKYLYDTILKAVASGKTTVTFNKSYSQSDIDTVYSSVVYDNSYLIWLSSIITLVKRKKIV